MSFYGRLWFKHMYMLLWFWCFVSFFLWNAYKYAMEIYLKVIVSQTALLMYNWEIPKMRIKGIFPKVICLVRDTLE